VTRTGQLNVGCVDLWMAVSVDVSCSKRHVSGRLVVCDGAGPLRQDEWVDKRGYIWCTIGGVSLCCFDAVMDGATARCNPSVKSVCCGSR